MTDTNNEEHKSTEDWESYVESEVLAALANFLPVSINGNIGILYKKAIVEQTEAGPVYDNKKVIGVEIVVDLNFAEAIDKPA